MLEFFPVRLLGKDRDKFCWQMDKKYGPKNWLWVFRVGKKLYSFDFGMQIYEDAYYQFFRNNVSKLKMLAENYYDVCMIDKDDLESGLDYHKQTQKWDHFADIAIRRSFVRLGVWFKGEKDLFKIVGSEYNDGSVPFHLPHLLYRSDPAQSAKAWIVSNRMIAVATAMEDQHKLSKFLVK